MAVDHDTTEPPDHYAWALSVLAAGGNTSQEAQLAAATIAHLIEAKMLGSSSERMGNP